MPSQPYLSLYSRLSYLLLGVFILSACGVPGPGSARNGSQSSKDDDTSNYAEVLTVRVEVNQAMRVADSWQEHLYDWLTPSKAFALSGLEDTMQLDPNRISIITLNARFQSRGIISPTPRVTKKQSGLGYNVQLQQAVVKQLNKVIRVSLPNGEVLYSPLYNVATGSTTVVVNVASHYVLKKLYDALPDEDALTRLLSCRLNQQETETNCPYQNRVKLKHIVNLIELVNNFDLAIDSNLSVAQVMNLFDDTPALRRMVEAGIAEILNARSPAARGTSRNFLQSDGYQSSQLHQSASYNSTFLSFELTQKSPQNAVKEVLYGAATSRVVQRNEVSNNLPIYPLLTHTTQFFQLRTDELTVDVPFTRTTLNYLTGNRYQAENNNIVQSHSVASIDSFLGTFGNIFAGSVVEQTIDSQSVGWQTNPIYKQLYRVNPYEPNLSAGANPNNTTEYPRTAPWLLSANYIKGENYRISRSGTGNQRTDFLEDRHIFAWEIHGKETDRNFNTGRMIGKHYGVVRFSLNLRSPANQTVTDVMTLTAETLLWSATSGNQIRSSQPNRDSESDTETHSYYSSHQIVRNSLSQTSAAVSLPATTTDHAYTAVPAEKVVPSAGTTEFVQTGLLRVDAGTQPTQGHVANAGNHFALAQNNNNLGRGIVIGTQLAGSTQFEGDEYVLQGNAMSMNGTNTALLNLNGSTLRLHTIEADRRCSAELTINTFEVAQNHETNVISDPISRSQSSTQNSVSSNGCRQKGGKLEIRFDQVLDKPLTLKGFIADKESSSAKANLLNLIWVQNDTLGLVFATRQQNLNPHFENQGVLRVSQ